MSTIQRWPSEKANDWYSEQPWLVGCNFIPSTAINQLEMWQAESFDPITIDRELEWAASIGFNTVRTYLHDLAWQADPGGFVQRIDRFLGIAFAKGIRPILVIFDDCWNAHPATGAQPAPVPEVHNSGWVQSPGLDVVHAGPPAWRRLEEYVIDTLGRFGKDERILFWDLYNEPGNSGNREKSLPLLQHVFDWARAAKPAQPLTSGLWFDEERLNQFQIASSDIISFHNYNPAGDLKRQIADLKQLGRPVVCTEWMARTRGSLVETNLSVFARENVGCINWGLVSGKTNTIFPWQSEPRSSTSQQPKPWFHDLFWSDGTPYDPKEVELFRELTGRGSPQTERSA